MVQIGLSPRRAGYKRRSRATANTGCGVRCGADGCLGPSRATADPPQAETGKAAYVANRATHNPKTPGYNGLNM